MTSNFGRRTWNREDYIDKVDYDETVEISSDEKEALKYKYTHYSYLMRLNSQGLNKRVLATNESQNEFKSGKKFGFYCDLCNLTYKDNLQYINHLNSKPHAIEFEKMFNEPLVIDQRDNDDIPVDEIKKNYVQFMNEFVDKNLDFEVKRTWKDARGQKEGNNKKIMLEKDKSQGDPKIASLMGFSGFNTTKK